jgi:hypothetical protein
MMGFLLVVKREREIATRTPGIFRSDSFQKGA